MALKGDLDLSGHLLGISTGLPHPVSLGCTDGVFFLCCFLFLWGKAALSCVVTLLTLEALASPHAKTFFSRPDFGMRLFSQHGGHGGLLIRFQIEDPDAANEAERTMW